VLLTLEGGGDAIACVFLAGNESSIRTFAPDLIKLLEELRFWTDGRTDKSACFCSFSETDSHYDSMLYERG